MKIKERASRTHRIVHLSCMKQVACFEKNKQESGGFAFTKGTHSPTFFSVDRDQRFQQLIIAKVNDPRRDSEKKRENSLDICNWGHKLYSFGLPEAADKELHKISEFDIYLRNK